MTPFTTLTAPALPLPFASIDTDQIIPARFMSRSRAEGYGDVPLHDMRQSGEAAVLDDPARVGAQIVVARRNFGSGSSREAAVYALADYGIRCVLAPSFGDIFAANAAANGLLAAVLPEAATEDVLARLAAGLVPLTVDLDACTVTAGDAVHRFEVDPVRRLKLLNGWDDFDLTARHADAIAAFTARDRAARPWASPSCGDG
jgi:3-isopropylmalate/(R)-2-methylmalate dehydratase small subunit